MLLNAQHAVGGAKHNGQKLSMVSNLCHNILLIHG